MQALLVSPVSVNREDKETQEEGEAKKKKKKKEQEDSWVKTWTDEDDFGGLVVLSSPAPI